MLLWIALALSLLAPDFSRQLAQIQEAIHQGDLGAAEQAAERLAQEFPSRPQPHHLIGIIRARQGRPQEAETAFQMALEADPSFEDTYLQLGLLQQQAGRPDAARQTLQQGLSRFPGNPRLLHQMAILSAARGDYAEAVRYLKQVPESEAPEGFWETVGRVLTSGGDYAGAESAYRKLLEQRPGSVRILRALSGLALKQQDKRRGWDYIAAARREAPNSPQVLYDFGQVSLANNLLAEALNAARLLLLLEPENPDYSFFLGRALLSADQLQQARSVFEEYLTRRPEDPNGHMMLGISLYRSGEFDAARAQFETARQQDARLTEAVYYLGMVAYSLAEDDKAKSLLSEVLTRDPSHGQARLGLGKLLLRQRKHQEAVEELQAAARLLADEPDVHFQLSRAYGQLGQAEQARQAVARYRELKALVEKRQQEASEMPYTLPERRP